MPHRSGRRIWEGKIFFTTHSSAINILLSDHHQCHDMSETEHNVLNLESAQLYSGRERRPGEKRFKIPKYVKFLVSRRFVRKTFCQDHLRRFVRKTFCQDQLRRFVRKTFCQDRFVRHFFQVDRLRRFVRKTFCQDRLTGGHILGIS